MWIALVIFLTTVIMLLAGPLMGLAWYYWNRRDFYARPLTAEEQWAESAQEAQHEEVWSAAAATQMPDSD